MKVRNVSPLGDVEVLGRIVPAGDVFEVSDEQGAALITQPDNFAPVVEPKAKEATK